MKRILTIMTVLLLAATVFAAGLSTRAYLSPKLSPILEWDCKVTAYCPCNKCCGQWSDGVTASGHRIKKGDMFCAAPKCIPFGTLIDIPEYGLVPVLDRGGAIKGNRLDVFFLSHNDALRWGVKNLTVQVWPKKGDWR